MYFPHRETILPNPTYDAFFQQHSETKLTNMSKYEKLTKQLDEAWRTLQEADVPEEARAEIVPNQDEERAEQAEEFEYIRQFQEESEEIEIESLPDLLPDSNISNVGVSHSVLTDIIASKDHKNRLSQLNSKQSQLFYFIRNWALKKDMVTM